MKYLKYIILLVFLVAGCGKIKEKTKSTLSKTGEIAGNAGSEFVKGVAKGVEETYKLKIEVSQNLTQRGIKIGKIIKQDSDSASDNVLNVYIISEMEFKDHVVLKVYDAEGLEMGRVKKEIHTAAGDAGFYSFSFHKLTNIDYSSRITME